MSIIGLRVLHKKNKEEGIIKDISVVFIEESFKILLTIEYFIEYDTLTYKTNFNDIMVI